MSQTGVVPSIALIAVRHDDPLVEFNFRLHKKLFSEAGFDLRSQMLDPSITQEELNGVIRAFNDDENVDAIMTLIPLPEHLDFREVLATTDPSKEVEYLHLDNVSQLNPISMNPPKGIPVLPLAVYKLLEEVDFDPPNLEVVVLTDPDMTETNPVAKMVTRISAFSALPADAAGCTVPVTHPRAKEICKNADLLIVSLQRDNVVTDEWVKPGAMVIDYNPVATGTREHPTEPGRTVPVLQGGIDTEKVARTAGYVVPIPGGVGPAVLGALADQTMNLALTRRLAHETAAV